MCTAIHHVRRVWQAGWPWELLESRRMRGGSWEVLRVTRAWATLCSRSNLIRRSFKISDELNRSFAEFSEPRLLPGVCGTVFFDSFLARAKKNFWGACYNFFVHWVMRNINDRSCLCIDCVRWRKKSWFFVIFGVLGPDGGDPSKSTFFGQKQPFLTLFSCFWRLRIRPQKIGLGAPKMQFLRNFFIIGVMLRLCDAITCALPRTMLSRDHFSCFRSASESPEIVKKQRFGPKSQWPFWLLL